MQTRKYLARILMWSALFTATATLPAMGQTNYPLRLRGSSSITTDYNGGNLFIRFQPGDSPAGNGLQPGQGSWLDRGLRENEPHVIKQTLSEEEAKAIADYLQSETHFATFYCYNTNQGYFEVANSTALIPASLSSNNSDTPVVWASALNLNGGSSGNGAVSFSNNTNTGGAKKDRDSNGHFDAPKDHRDDGKEHREVAKQGHDEGKEHHDKNHQGGTGNHGIVLVKAHPKPLVKTNPKPAPKVTTKAGPRPPSKKKA
jgi:hypothetical protein